MSRTISRAEPSPLNDLIELEPLGAMLALGAALAFACLDFLRKRLADRLDHRLLLFWLTLGAAPLFATWALIEGRLPAASYWLPACGSGLLNVAANLLFLRAVKVGGLSGTIPMLAFTPVLTSVIAVLVLREVPTTVDWLGIVAVVVGGAVLALAMPVVPGGVRGRTPERVGALLMLAVAFLWSNATAFDKLALAASSPAFHGLFLHLVLASTMWCLWRWDDRGTRLGDLHGSGWLIAVSVLVGFAALAMQLLALERIYAGLMETLKRGMGSVLALTLGSFLLREVLTLRKALAVAIMVAGVALIMM